MANKVSMNLTKTTHIIFRLINTTEQCVVIKYKNNIKQVTNHMFLGVWFNENLSWNVHVFNYCK